MDKYKGSVAALEDLTGPEEFVYMFAKPYLDEVLEERKAMRERSSVQVKRGRNEFEDRLYDDYGADRYRADVERRKQESVERTVRKEKRDDTKDTLLNAAKVVLNRLNIPYNAGEFLADTMIAKKYYEDMNETGRMLVNKYGRNIGAADGIDDYYHPLLQCELAKISPQSKKNGITLGYLKEAWDYIKKISSGKKHSDIVADSKKDLRNNELGSKLGSENLDTACEILLDYLRTENMKNEKIR